jgi:hypothetical protein
MKLDAWLKQDHPLVDRLLVVERLSQALNEAHDRGEPLVALQPETIDVSGDGRVDLGAARRGAPAGGYGAPERFEGAPPSPEADVYSAGAVAWEVLAGRPCGTSPTHLSEAAPDLPQELADAVMACLERSPQWRPRDLTYLAQLAQHAQGSRRRAEPPARAAQPAPRATARAGGARGTRATRASGGDSAGRMRLVIGAVLTLGIAGAASYVWFARNADRGGRGPVAAVSPAPALAVPTATPEPAALPSAAPAATPEPAAANTPASIATPPPTTVTTTTTTTLPAATTPPVTTAAAEPAPSRPSTTVRTGTASPAAPPAVPPTSPSQVPASSTQPQAPAQVQAPPPTAPGASAATAAPQAPLVLAAVSPLSVRRPGKVLLDLRGSGIHDGVRVRVLPLREAPRGIEIVRLKRESDVLVRVLLDLDAQVAPGAYAIALEDSDGRQTKPLAFTVTR